MQNHNDEIRLLNYIMAKSRVLYLAKKYTLPLTKNVDLLEG
jgi:hypothetical protein